EPVDAEEPGRIRRPGELARAEPSTPRRWYGWPILTTDGTAYVLLAAALSHEKSTPYVVLPSLGGYLLGGPIVHAANGQWGHAGISLLLRGALPLSSVVLGATSSCNGGSSGDCARTALSVGIAFMAIATVLDLS